MILIVVDRLSKMAHFIPIKGDGKAPEVAKLFRQHIFRLHGMPSTITSVRDGRFVSDFWTELLHLLGTKLSIASTKHPETDGQSERTIQTLEEYLRSYIKYDQKDWDEHLDLAEFAYNSSVHSSTKLSPFQVDGNHQPYTPISLLQDQSEYSFDA